MVNFSPFRSLSEDESFLTLSFPAQFSLTYFNQILNLSSRKVFHMIVNQILTSFDSIDPILVSQTILTLFRPAPLLTNPVT